MSALEIATVLKRVPESAVVMRSLCDVHRIVIASNLNVETASVYAAPLPMRIAKVLMPLAAVLLGLEAVDATASVECVAF